MISLRRRQHLAFRGPYRRLEGPFIRDWKPSARKSYWRLADKIMSIPPSPIKMGTFRMTRYNPETGEGGIRLVKEAL